MPLKSDISIDVAKFAPQNTPAQTAEANENLINILKDGPKWFERFLPRDDDRMIPCRLVYPSWRKTFEERRKTRAIKCLTHGGGWVLGDQHSADTLLQFYADAGDLAVISVGYRLAPEYPFPCGPNDCIDVGEYLARNGELAFGSSLRFIWGRECWCPSIFAYAFLPGMTNEQKKNPLISPYYENLEKFRGRLPSALFTCGTEDPLLDDSVTMATKWMMTGGEAFIKVYTGAPHSFIGLADMLKEARDAQEDTKTYIKDCMTKL
ncbi:hypothetical protein DID88_003787 [Monilinia fructigena]|uniref:Alpha/beta hydrolase fold-3 domain-containing protein n=1 Tax=Monilinia fructigena TaxID=38457 RepID=A0A395IU26_9HELO|nr:hypothetical protein DID88_003787 [Monilinia fructigena]